MNTLTEIINYYRLHPQGYYVCGVDYGYGDEYINAKSLYGDKILQLWKIQSGWRAMVSDFRKYLVSRHVEHDDDDNPMGDINEKTLEYGVELKIKINPEYATYFQKKGYDFSSNEYYKLIFTINNETNSIEGNAIELQLIEKNILSCPARCFFYVAIDENEFYFSNFNSEEELSSKIKDALLDDET